VLLLGADGFIGRHIAFHLRRAGVQVIAQARNPARLKRIGFATPQADFTNRATYALYLLALLCWAQGVLLRRKIRDLVAQAVANRARLPPQAQKLCRSWLALGWPAFAALVAVFWLMVNKPQF
jgi:uncharacterized membrane protein